MKEICTITVPFDVGAISPNQLNKVGLRERMKRKTMAKKSAWVAWLQAGKPRSIKAVVVDVVIRRAKIMDDDNAKASLKHLIDGLFKMAITPDDSLKYFELGTVTQDIAPRHRYNATVEFVVRERNAAAE